MSLSFDGRMWLMGGWYNGRLPGHGASGEVWSSTDGVNWTMVTKNAGWSPRIAAGAVVFKGRMWILGGTEDYYFGDDTSLKNDVWSSADGKEWKQETARAPWSPRAYHAAVVHDGKLWVIGGGNYVPKYHALNDVWCSPDGVHWQQVTDHAPWNPRIWFSAVVHRDRMWVLGGWSNHPCAELGRRLALARRPGVDSAPFERGLEGTPRAFRLCLPRQDLGRGRPRPAAQQRGLVARDTAGLVRGPRTNHGRPGGARRSQDATPTDPPQPRRWAPQSVPRG